MNNIVSGMKTIISKDILRFNDEFITRQNLRNNVFWRVSQQVAPLNAPNPY